MLWKKRFFEGGIEKVVSHSGNIIPNNNRKMRKEIEGYLLAVGMCGQGFMLGPGLGELLARMALRQETADDAETLAILSPYREFKGMEKLK